MFMIKDFKIFERVKNDKLMNYYAKDVLSRLERWSEKNKIDYKKKVSIYPSSIDISFKFVFYTEKDIDNAIKKFVESLKKNLLNHNIILSYDIESDHENNFNEVTSLSVCIKNILTNLVKPNKYIYHTSKTENRESIEKNGLIPKYSGYWNHQLEYPPAIFAINGNTSKLWFQNVDNRDIWRIDTEKLPNKWWEDLNIGFSDKTAIMTFDPIPSEYLKRINLSERI